MNSAKRNKEMRVKRFTKQAAKQAVEEFFSVAGVGVTYGDDKVLISSSTSTKINNNVNVYNEGAGTVEPRLLQTVVKPK